MIPAVCPLVVAGALTTGQGTSLEIVNPTQRTYTVTLIKAGVMDVHNKQFDEYSEQQTSALPVVVRVYAVKQDIPPTNQPAFVPFPLTDDPNLLAGQFDIECN